LAEEDVVVSVVGDTSGLEKSLENVAKQIAKFSRTTNSALENISDSLFAVADAAKGMGTGLAAGARRGTQELKKLEDQAARTAKNISSAGPSKPLSDAGVARVQAAMAESPSQAQQQLNAELEREVQARREIEDAQARAIRATEEAVKQEKLKAEEARRSEKALREQEKAEAELINKTAIANVLFLRKRDLLDESADQAELLREAISKVTPAVQQAVNALPRLRYALFDVARGAAILSAGLAATVVIPAGLAISYRREFADVVRTTGVAGAEIEKLRQDFIRLKQDIPISWKEITDIGTLAGQLGISSNLIADFTASVARFAATTDLNVEQTATLFGRLNQLIGGVDGQFEKLGAAINKVGVISVATESQIGAVAQNIASIANLSKFSAAEVVGLAGSLASLGIAPELARGTVTRLFSNINTSIAVGGRNLQEYGRLTGQTAEDFANAWRNAPADALIEFFAGIDREGGRAERTLRDLGITSVRDIPAILRLAQNQELVANLIAESVDAFELGTESQTQYAAITSTVAERLKLLSQNFQLLIATVGDSANALGPLVDKANELVRALINVTNNDVARWALFAAGAVTLFVAGIVAFVGFVAIAGAKASGLVTALIDTQRALLGTSASAKIAEVGLLGFIRAETAAIAQTRLFINVLKGFLVLGAISLAFAAVGAAINAYTKAQRDAGERARDYFGEISSFTEAVKADTKAHLEGADAIAVRKVAIEKDERSIDQAEKTLRAWVKGQEDSEKATRKNTDAVKDQEIAFGDAAFAIASDLVINDEGFRRAAQDPAIVSIFENAGITYRDVLFAAFNEGESAEELVRNLIEPVRQEFLRLQAEQVEIDPLRLSELFAGAVPITELERDLVAAFQLYDNFISLLGPVSSALDDLIESQTESAAATALLGKETNDAASLTSEAIGKIIDDIFGAANATEKTQEALSRLGDSFREVGEEALGASKEIQGTISAILEEFPDPEQAINELIGFLNFLASVGVDVTAPAMQYLRDVIFQVGAAAGKTAADVNVLLGTMANVPVFTDFAAGFERVGKSASGAAKKVKTFNEQMRELIDSLFEVANAQQSASDAIFNLGEAFGEIGDEAFYAGSEMQSAIKSIVAASGNGEEAVANLSALLGTLSSQSGVSGASLQVLRQVIEEVGSNAGLSAARIQQLIQSAGGGLATVALNNFSRGVSAANREVRTLVDYASDLSRVFGRAFDIRFKATLNVDAIADSWQQLNDEVESVTNNLAKLSADQNVKRYFLSIAEAYGDSLRADVLRAELAEIDSEIKKAQDSLSREVIGDSSAARENRRVITGLVSQYQEYIASLAESGASQDELREAVQRARSDFEQQARQLGFSEQVIQQYGAAFDDVRTAIDKVPRNITVEANVDPALQALNELNASLNKNIEAARTLNTELGKPVSSGGGGGSVTGLTAAQRSQLQAEEKSLLNRISALQSDRTLYARAGQLTAYNNALNSLQNQLANVRNRLAKGFAQGGFTGRGGKYEPAGIVHRGEYVVPKQFVNQSTGMPDPAFLAQLQNGMRSFAGGGFVGGGTSDAPMMVELSPYDRKLLADAGNVQLRLNGRVVAEATNANNFNQAQRGAN
jgi:TP901 family phage tail tape measure protein